MTWWMAFRSKSVGMDLVPLAALFIGGFYLVVGSPAFLPFGAGFLDNVHCIVRREQPHPDVSLFLRQAQHQEGLVMRTEREEKIRLLAGMQFTKLRQTLLVG